MHQQCREHIHREIPAEEHISAILSGIPRETGALTLYIELAPKKLRACGKESRAVTLDMASNGTVKGAVLAPTQALALALVRAIVLALGYSHSHRKGAQVGLRQELGCVGVVADAGVQEPAGHAADEVRAWRRLQRPQRRRRGPRHIPVRKFLQSACSQHQQQRQTTPSRRMGRHL